LWSSVDNLPRSAAGEFRYILINQAAFADRITCIEKLAIFDRHALLQQPISACCDGATPFLITLEQATPGDRPTRILEGFCDEACYASALSVLDSSLPPERMAQALTQRCDAVLPDRSEVLLRYFDTRIMASLVVILEPEQRADLLSCASAWWFAGRDGQVIRAPASTPGGWDLSGRPIRFSLTQVAALNQASIPDGVIDTLTRANLKALIEIPYALRYPLIQKHLADARNWGIKEKTDLAAYCALALESGSGFEEIMPWSELLSRVAQDELQFSEALSLAGKYTA
jgi:hypothetical protein